MSERLLVIKLSALGDFVQAFAPFQAIRKNHPKAHITLLTTTPYEELAEASGWFDDVHIDHRPKLYNLPAISNLRRFLRAGKYSRVYDLQTSNRSSMYRRLMWPQNPEWSGIAVGCSHPHSNPDRDKLHTIDRQCEQLHLAGIRKVPPADVSWLKSHAYPFSPKDRFVLLIPGGAPHRPDKRWPSDHYAALANLLVDNGFTPLVIGTKTEAAEAELIQKACPKAQSLIAKTSIFDLAALCFKATAAVGNDTGPMHLAAVTGCPSLVLYSKASDPALCGQRGKYVDILRNESLDSLSVETVWQHITKLIK